MSIQTINAGDTGLKARTTINSIGQAAQISLSGRTATIMGFGDSFSSTNEATSGYLSTAIRWARTYWEPGLDVRMLNGFGQGGTQSTALASQFASYVAAGVVPDIAVVSTFQNDGGNLLTEWTTRIAAYRTFINNLLNSGVKLVIIVNVAPPTSIIKELLNNELRNIVATTPGTALCEIYGQFLNPAAAVGAPNIELWKSNPTQTVRWTIDGTHPSNEGCKDWGKALADILGPICRKRVPYISSNEIYNRDDATLRYANMVRAGNMNGTSGQLNGVDNSGVAGFAATANSRWSITTTNGLICTPSIVTGSDGIRRQRMTISGTVGGSGYGTLTLAYAAGGFLPNPPSTQFYRQSVIDFNNVTELCVFGGDTGANALMEPFDPSGTSPQIAMLPLTGRVFSFGFGTTGSNADGTILREIRFSFRQGSSPSGTIDVGQVGAWITPLYVP